MLPRLLVHQQRTEPTTGCAKGIAPDQSIPVLDIPFYLGKGDVTGVQVCLDLVRRLIIRGEHSAARPVHNTRSDT